MYLKQGINFINGLFVCHHCLNFDSSWTMSISNASNSKLVESSKKIILLPELPLMKTGQRLIPKQSLCIAIQALKAMHSTSIYYHFGCCLQKFGCCLQKQYNAEMLFTFIFTLTNCVVTINVDISTFIPWPAWMFKSWFSAPHSPVATNTTLLQKAILLILGWWLWWVR